MKILVVSPYFYPQTGGLESYVYFMSKGLIASKHEIVVITSNKSRKDKIEYIGGMKIYRLKTFFTLSNTPINPLWLLKISKIVREEKPDIISAHSPVPFLADISCLIAKIYDIPFVLTYHSGSFKKNQWLADIITKIYSSSVEKIVFNNSKKIVVLNNFVRDTTLAKYKTKVELILPGITLQSKNKKLSLKSDLEKNRMLFVGKLERTHEWKGLSYLLEGMKVVLNKKPNMKLQIIGGGNHMNFYKKMVLKLRINMNVVFAGSMPNSRMEHYYKNNDFLVLPSYSNAESLGLVMIEAMSFGLPIVATKVGGIPYIIKNKVNGILVESKNPTSLANGILELISDKKSFEKYRKNNFEKSNQYDWDLHIRSLEKLFNSIIKV